MAKQVFVRIAGGTGLISLALLFVGLIPFLSADPIAGAGLAGRTPTFSVNHKFKGDRLPVNSVVSRNAIRAQEHPQEIPVGCDPSFSPISAPRSSSVFGRCLS